MNNDYENKDTENGTENDINDFYGFDNFAVIDDSSDGDTVCENKSRKNGIFAKIVAVILAMALVSFASIQIYRHFSADEGGRINTNGGYAVPTDYTTFFGTSDVTTVPLSTEEIAQKVRPSIVTVICQVQSSTNGFGQSTVSTASGSGIIITQDGYIVTNYHVIEGSISVEVYLNDDTKYVATIVGGDSLSDLAVLKIDASGLPAAEFGNSDELKVGEKAVAIGNPLGIEFAGTVTQGIISGLDREVQISGVSMTLIQTDATINPGNSGGALVNQYGQVIGVTSSKISITYAEGIAFAIPSNDTVKVVNDLINLGYVSGRPYLGISGSSVTYYMQMYYGVPQGIYITDVTENSPAAAAGIKKGDIITKIDGTSVTSASELNNIKNSKKIGDEIVLTIYSYKEYKEVTVKLAEYLGN